MEGKASKKNIYLRIAVMVVLGIAVNLTGGLLASRFGIMLYLDSIGTVVVAALCGAIPGMVVGLATNFIISVSNPASAYYAVINVLIAVFTDTFARRDLTRRLSSALFLIFSLSFLGGGLSAVLTYFIYGFAGSDTTAAIATQIYESGRVGMFHAQLAADLAVDLADKFLTVLIAVLVLRAVPQQFSEDIHLRGWLQTPLSGSFIRELRDSRCRKVSLRIKLLLLVTVALLLIAVLAIWVSYNVYVGYFMQQVTQGDAPMDAYSFLVRQIAAFLGFFVIILSVGLWLAQYNIIYPINSIARCAVEFTGRQNDSFGGSLQQIKDLQIHTGDEIENLYNSFLVMAEDSVWYMSDIKKKTDEMNRTHNGLILVLADLVESRDRNTGQHVRKTAAYTWIILDELRKEDKFRDIITDEYIHTVINSAPLHDIGKITVPDAILNKPGRLTDEEFDIMKGHTVAGRDIIENAILTLPDSDYLNEAKNVAAYHHEKWNGTGYPEGLKGEEIPLSARIMAVADVFDALVSKRSYKEGMPLEKAFEIIREGKGTHFDPQVAQAFLNAEEAVRDVATAYEEIADINV